MKRNALTELDFGGTTRKRAQWEAFEFSVPTTDVVVVTNASYADSDEHTHSVNVEGGVPVGCSCKADEFGSGACKHRVAVALTNPVLEAASATRSAEKRAIADGGTVLPPEPQGESEENTRPAGCDCLPSMDVDDLGCWSCYRDGYETANPLASED